MSEDSQYWKNRRAGQRGQGPYPNVLVGYTPAPGPGRAQMRKKRHATKSAMSSNSAYQHNKEAIAQRVERQQKAAHQMHLERRALKETARRRTG